MQSTLSPAARLSQWMPKLVIAPSFILAMGFIYGLMAWNGYLSLSASRLLPNYEFVGIEQYVNLFDSERWWVALGTLGIFGGLFLFFGLPNALLLTISFLKSDAQQLTGELTLDNYEFLFTERVYLQALLRTFVVCVSVGILEVQIRQHRACER